MYKINVRTTSARNGTVDTDEHYSDTEILVHNIITADIFTVRAVESEAKWSCMEVIQRFLPLRKIKFKQVFCLSAIKIVALRNDVNTAATYVG
jgi:hypothetical protein